MKSFKKLSLNIIVVFAVLLSSCSSSNELKGVNGKELGNNIKFGDIYNTKAAQVYKLKISNSNGESQETKNKVEIDKFIQTMNKAAFVKQASKNETKASFIVDLFDKDDEKEYIRITFPTVEFSKYSKSKVEKSSNYEIQDKSTTMNEIEKLYNEINDINK